MLESLGKKLGQNDTPERTSVWESSRGSLCGREFEHLDRVGLCLGDTCLEMLIVSAIVQVLTQVDTHAMHDDEYFDFCHNIG